MALTLLQLCQRVARRIGVGAPVSVIGSAAAGLLHEVALETGEDLLKSHEWSILRTIRRLPGAATIPFASDHDRMAGPGQGELWDVATGAPANGPLDTWAWDRVSVQQPVPGVGPYWSLIGGRINLSPAPTGTTDISYTYISRNWVVAANDATLRLPTFVTDADTTVFADDLMRRGMRWFYLQTKGFAYEEALSDYERAKERAISRDRGPRVVDTAYPWTQGPGGYPDNFFAGTIVVGGNGDGGLEPEPLTHVSILVDGVDVSEGNPLPVEAVP